jgi:hypothetical protein
MSRREADIAIRLAEFEQHEVVVRHVGRGSGWVLYERAPKLDQIEVYESMEVTVKKRGRAVTVSQRGNQPTETSDGRTQRPRQKPVYTYRNTAAAMVRHVASCFPAAGY